MKRFIPLVMVLMIGSACNSQVRSPLEIEMYNAAGDSLGTATLSEQPDGVQIKLKLEGLTPGFHAIHVHEFPECDGPDFKSAGNHYNPDSKKHGLMHPEGPHLGDLQNIEVEGDGTVDAEIMANKATLKDDKYSLLTGGGTSLIIHAGQDDGVSQPAGNAGERIACGKIQLEEKDQEQDPQNPAETGEEQNKDEE